MQSLKTIQVRLAGFHHVVINEIGVNLQTQHTPKPLAHGAEAVPPNAEHS
jgi:hypothetical protein